MISSNCGSPTWICGTSRATPSRTTVTTFVSTSARCSRSTHSVRSPPTCRVVPQVRAEGLLLPRRTLSNSGDAAPSSCATWSIAKSTRGVSQLVRDPREEPPADRPLKPPESFPASSWLVSLIPEDISARSDCARPASQNALLGGGRLECDREGTDHGGALRSPNGGVSTRPPARLGLVASRSQCHPKTASATDVGRRGFPKRMQLGPRHRPATAGAHPRVARLRRLSHQCIVTCLECPDRRTFPAEGGISDPTCQIPGAATHHNPVALTPSCSVLDRWTAIAAVAAITTRAPSH